MLHASSPCLAAGLPRFRPDAPGARHVKHWDSGAGLRLFPSRCPAMACTSAATPPPASASAPGARVFFKWISETRPPAFSLAGVGTLLWRFPGHFSRRDFCHMSENAVPAGPSASCKFASGLPDRMGRVFCPKVLLTSSRSSSKPIKQSMSAPTAP